MKSDGKNPIRLTNGQEDGWSAWSPDGSRIAYTSVKNGNYDIYVMNANGKNVIQLTETSAKDIFPSWSPDGKSIAFSSDRDGNKRDVYVMDADGSNVRQLTNHPADESQTRWSPAGISIAGGKESEISEGAWFGTLQCQRDTNGDGEPETTASFLTTDEYGYVVFLFGNLENGMVWSSSYSGAINFTPFMTDYWQSGPAGLYAYKIPLRFDNPGKIDVTIIISNIQREIECRVVNP